MPAFCFVCFHREEEEEELLEEVPLQRSVPMVGRGGQEEGTGRRGGAPRGMADLLLTLSGHCHHLPEPGSVISHLVVTPASPRQAPVTLLASPIAVMSPLLSPAWLPGPTGCSGDLAGHSPV